MNGRRESIISRSHHARLHAVRDTSRKTQVQVKIRLKFLKLGEIDTVKETFKATILLEATWHEPRLDGIHRAGRKFELRNWEDFWSPRLYLDNVTEEPRECTWYRVEYSDGGRATVTRTCTVKGTFHENMELRRFPFDTQDLTVVIVSELNAREILMTADKAEVNNFINASEWSLHDQLTYHVHNPAPPTSNHVTNDVSNKTPPLDFDHVVRRSVDVETGMYPDVVGGNLATNAGHPRLSPHPSVSVACRATRRASYFVFNVVLIIMLLGVLIFCTFAVDLVVPQHRIAISFTLLLVHITFKGTVHRSLPKISYLTYLDMYIGCSMLHMAAVGAWHALVGLLWTDDTDIDSARHADKIALVVLSCVYIAFNVAFFSWSIITVHRNHKELHSISTVSAVTSEPLEEMYHKKPRHRSSRARVNPDSTEQVQTD